MTSLLKIFGIVLFIWSNPVNNRVDKLIQKEVQKTFEIENFESVPITVSDDVLLDTPLNVDGNNYFTIKNSSDIIGYYYLGKGYGKSDFFDFIIIFNSDLIVSKVKVLVYREDHGGEIGSKRWLKQFVGKASGEELNYNDVIAISGATLSARSITEEMNKAMKTIAILKENQQI